MRVDQAGARRVDEIRRRLHLGQFFPADEMLRFFREAQMKRHNIRLMQQFIQRHKRDIVIVELRRISIRVIDQHPALKSLQTHLHTLSDISESDDPDRHFVHIVNIALVIVFLAPFSFHEQMMAACNIFVFRDHHADGKIGDGICTPPRRVDELYPSLR